MRLSGFDHFFTGSHAPSNIYVFESKDRAATDRFRDSLLALAPELLTLRGTLRKLDDSTLEFAEGGPGPQVSSLRLNSLPRPDDFEGILRMVDAVKSVPGEPLLRIRTLEAPEGFLLTVSVSHASFDSIGTARLLQEAGRRIRGEKPASLQEDRSPLLLTGALPPPARDPDEYLRRTGRYWTPGRMRDNPFVGEYEREFLSKAEIDRDLARIDDEDPFLEASSNDVICARLLKADAARLRGVKELVSCWSHSLRGELPGLSPAFLGNAVVVIRAHVPYEDLMQPDLLPTVRHFKDAKNLVSKEAALDALGCMEATRLERGLSSIDELGIPRLDAAHHFSNLGTAEAMVSRACQAASLTSRVLGTVQNVCWIYPETARDGTQGFIAQTYRGRLAKRKE